MVYGFHLYGFEPFIHLINYQSKGYNYTCLRVVWKNKTGKPTTTNRPLKSLSGMLLNTTCDGIQINYRYKFTAAAGLRKFPLAPHRTDFVNS